MKNRIIFTILALLICNLSLFSRMRPNQPQNPGRNIQKIDTTPDKSPKQIDSLIIRSEFNNNIIDQKSYALYRAVHREHGWWCGTGAPITDAQAEHLWCYYKLSKKNNNGNWCKLEALNGYGQPNTMHSINPYLVKIYDDTDKGASSEWQEKMKKVCQWELIADKDGKVLLQERGIDANGNIIYIFTPSKIGVRKFVGTYTDHCGIPIMLRTDDEGKYEGYANYVYITRDSIGRDILLAYTDKTGSLYTNRDGAYMRHLAYDAEGRLVEDMSLNIVGKPMIDKWGVCGLKREYKNGLLENIVYIDTQGNPMRLSGDYNDKKDVIKKNYIYDEYGRETEEFYTLADGTPDTTSFGLHKIVTKYTDRGNICRLTGYDINGNYASIDTINVADIVYKFDESSGKELGYEVYDKYGKPSDYYEYSKEVRNYCGDRYVGRECYSPVNGNHKIIYRYSIDDKGNDYYEWTSENICCFDSVGSPDNNSTISETWKDMQGNLVNGRDGTGYARYRKQYISDEEYPSVTKYVEQWYTADGNGYYNKDRLCAKRVVEIDSESNIEREIKYDDDDVVLYACENTLDYYNNEPYQDWNLTPCGERARTGSTNTAYYSLKYYPDINGKYNRSINLNEFGEQTYSTTIDERNTIYCIKDTKNNRYFDEDGKEISGNMTYIRESLPGVFCIEVTDTIEGNRLGLKNGDIILSYGDWTAPEDLTYNATNKFYIASIMNMSKRKQMDILRYFPETRTDSIITISLQEGSWDDFGFYPHRIYYTRKEKSRLLDVCARRNYKLSEKSDQQDEAQAFVLVPLKGYRYGTEAFHFQKIKAPSLILSTSWVSEVYDIDYRWNVQDNTPEMFDKGITNSQLGGSLKYCLSYDGIKSRVKMFRNWSRFDYLGLATIGVNIDSITLNHLKELHKDNYSKSFIRRKSSLYSDAVYDKNLIDGQWTVAGEQYPDRYTEGEICFDKKSNSVEGYLTEYVAHDMRNLGTAIFRITYTLDGKYEMRGDTLMFSPKDNIVYGSCVDFVKNDISYPHQVENINSLLLEDEDFKKDFYSNILDYKHWTNCDICILCLNKKELKVDNGLPNGLVLRRTKKNKSRLMPPEETSSIQ